MNKIKIKWNPTINLRIESSFINIDKNVRKYKSPIYNINMQCNERMAVYIYI